MMHRTMIVAAAVMLCAAPALAADDVMAGYYGNTIVSTGGGFESRTHLRADHTFDAVFTAAAGSLASKGTWLLDAQGQLCRTYDNPPPGITNPICIPNQAHKVGDSWTVTVAGQTRDVTLLAGVQ